MGFKEGIAGFMVGMVGGIGPSVPPAQTNTQQAQQQPEQLSTGRAAAMLAEIHSIQEQNGIILAEQANVRSWKIGIMTANRRIEGKLDRLLQEWDETLVAAQEEGLKQGIEAAKAPGVLGVAADAAIMKAITDRVPQAAPFMGLIKDAIPLIRADVEQQISAVIIAKYEEDQKRIHPAKLAEVPHGDPGPAPAAPAAPPAPGGPREELTDEDLGGDLLKKE